MGARKITCDVHGDRDATFVCGHICASHGNRQTVGFNYSSESDEKYPNAWCDACDDFLMANGGDWNDTTDAFAQISVLCSGCYLQRKSFAEEAERLTKH